MSTLSLFPSQQQSLEELERVLLGNPQAVAILSGFSGLGKSTLVSEIAKRNNRTIQEVSVWALPERYENTLAVCESGERDNASILENITAARKNAWRVLVLAQAQSAIATQIAAAGIPVAEFSLHPLTEKEIDAWVCSKIPGAGEHERAIIREYSGGIPLLVQRMVENVPITVHAARETLTAYIVSYIRQQQFFGSPEELERIVRGTFGANGVTLPSDIAWEKVQRAVFNHHHDPLAVLGEAKVPFAMPRSADTCRQYQAWIEKRDAAIISIFLPNVPGGSKVLKEELGLNAWDVVDRFEGRLKAFGGNARKVSIFSTNSENQGQPNIRGFEGCGSNAKMLDLFLRAHSMGECDYIRFDSQGERKGAITLVPGAEPLLLVAYDHEGMYHNQLCIGLGMETYLQAHGTPYKVRYGTGDVWSYDPEHGSLEKYLDKDAFEEPHTRELAEWRALFEA